MTFEPLKNKRVDVMYEDFRGVFGGLSIISDDDGKFFKFDDVKSAVGFYKKYKYHLDLLKQKEPEAFKKWCNSSEYTYFKKELKNKNPLIAEEYYRDWLFDYSFQDVI